MHKNATKCNKILSKWCKNKHEASKIIDTFETYQGTPMIHSSTYHILSVLCISMFHFLCYSCSYFYFPKHKKTKNISVISLSLSFSFLASFCFTCYFWSDVWKIQKYFALFAISFCSYFKKSKTQKYLLFFFGFVKFVAEFSLPWLHWSLVFASYYSSHTSERQ
jgi:hypothetical protein